MIRLFLLFFYQCSLFASFSGQIIDANTSKPIPFAFISDGEKTIQADKNGSFIFQSNAKKYFIKAYGYKPYHTEQNTTKIKLTPIHIKALYLNFWNASNHSKKLKNILNIIDKTQINAIVVDIKNSYGSTSFLTSFQQANDYGAYKKRTNRNIQKFIQLMKQKNIYTIARIITFKDELQAIHNPNYAIKNPNGTLWRSADNKAWVDPFDTRSHKYTIAIAKEAAKVGFDEINFDYLRFPAKKELQYSQENNASNRIKAITHFLQLAKQELQKYGVFISVDIYGNICWVKNDGNIGQTITSLAKYADYISPMLYPSSFSSGSFHSKYPASKPYEVVYKSLKNIKNKINSKRIRPWLQHFRDYNTKRIKYTKTQIQQQIKATQDAHTSGWMLWSPSSRYHKDYYN
ncbi:COG1306 predicted glycoside hydrolase [hydrothermal vent metagenome]|uniref:COG1306 predicted glycoside hydrolase n=1 Tax=hydrothermal vent metagenome TaxID=652676 RepID=A0A1W1D3Q0_9ZZZZ